LTNTIKDISTEVFELYNVLDGNDKVAKGSELIAKLKENLSGKLSPADQQC